jgi:hypothetical protein
MPLPIGNLGHFGFLKESVFGTPVVPTKFLPLKSEGLVVDKGIITNVGMMGNRHEDHVALEGPQSIGGDISFPLYPTELPHFLIAAMGAPVTASLEAGAAGSHVFLSGKNAAQSSLTVEIDRETRADRYAGCKVNTLEFEVSGDQDSPIVATAGLIAQSVASASPATPSYPTQVPFIFWHASTITIGGSDVKARMLAAKIRLENNLEERRALNGQKYPAAVDEGSVKVTGSFTMYFDSAAEYADYLANTTRAVILEFIGAVIAGTTSYTLKFNLPKCVFTAAPVNLEAEGQVLLPIEFTADHDSTVGGALEVTVKNNVSTAP